LAAKRKEFLSGFSDFSSQMAAASLTIVALVFVIVFEFEHSNNAFSYQWLRLAHSGILAVIFFSIAAFMGVIVKSPFVSDKLKNTISWLMFILFSIGWLLLFYLLIMLYFQTF
jgi:hypothetical protein